MGAGEDCCERVGSFVKDWTGKTSDQNVARLMDSVVLHAAKVLCVGAARDDVLVSKISDFLRETKKGSRPTQDGTASPGIHGAVSFAM